MGIVVVTDHVFPHLDVERQILRAAGHELRYERDLRDPGEIVAAAADADALLNCYSPVPAEVIERLRRCRIIARYGIGLDTIDIPAATGRGIVVTNVPDYCIDEVSDHALALILALVRGIGRLDRSVRGGGWDPMVARPLHRIRGRVLGLVGFGRIARRLAEKASVIGFEILATDPFVADEAIRAAGVRPADLNALMSESDVVSVHAPMTDENRHLIGGRELGLLRDGAMLVNTSRGPLVDLDALRAELETGRLGGAALDVLEREPPVPGDPLLHRDDVLITPHAAFYSEESMAEQQRKAAEQVVAALAGQVPPYAVNADVIGPGRP
ncbi:MAG TPA: C-terminal binding protein [Actinomycetota bacterium]|nr:C-terminal binding protein [Actinomycetota bacterium]